MAPASMKYTLRHNITASQCGATMVEALVVIAALVVVLTLGIPAYSKKQGDKFCNSAWKLARPSISYPGFYDRVQKCCAVTMAGETNCF